MEDGEEVEIRIQEIDDEEIRTYRGSRRSSDYSSVIPKNDQK